MRIGLIGLGRIGAFHAETASALPSVTSLVVTDAVAAAVQPVVDKHGVEARQHEDPRGRAAVATTHPATRSRPSTRS